MSLGAALASPAADAGGPGRADAGGVVAAGASGGVVTPPAAEQAFAYHRAVAPMMWVLIALMSLELLVVHGLLALWWPVPALMLSALTLAMILWFVRAILSFRRLPVLLSGERVLMRVGTIRAVSISLADIAAIDGEVPRAELGRDTLNLALIAHPNIRLRLHRPLAGRRRTKAVAHRLDDPAGFTAALAHLRADEGAARAAA